MTAGLSTAPMDDPQLEHERKYDVSRAEAEVFFARTAERLAPEQYDAARPVAYTRTTYLDTDDLELLRSSESQVMRRMRLREYAGAASLDGTPELTGVAFVELKSTQGPRRLKVRLPAPPHVVAEILRGQPVDPAFCAELAALAIDRGLAARLGSGALRPRITTFYRRVSLAGDEGRVRVTLDEGLTFAAPPPAGAPGEPAEPARTLGRGPTRLLEVKHTGGAPDWLAGATTGLTEAAGLSKYHLAMASASKPQDTRRTMPLAIPMIRVRGA